MAEPAVAPVVVTPEPAPVPVGPEVQAFLDKYHLDSLEKADEVLGGLKNDVTKLKGDKQTLTASQVEYEKLKTEAEARRQAELTEVEKLNETVGTKDKSIADLQVQIESMKRSGIRDKVLFTHAKDKSLLNTRMKLYEVAAKSQEWDSADSLKAIFATVDSDFDEELKSSNIRIPAPGDGSGAGPTGDNQHKDFFAKFNT